GKHRDIHHRPTRPAVPRTRVHRRAAHDLTRIEAARRARPGSHRRDDQLDPARHDAGVLRRDFTADDLYYADVANGLALLAEPKPSREDYDRRTRFFLESLRPR